MSFTFQELTRAHPCFSTGEKSNKGRVHLPVSPGCNIWCRFCDRKINQIDQRPGVTATIISPDEAVEAVRRAVELCPAITVAGVAGPGDTLATPYALETFRRIKRELPDIIKCMSTNGLLLPQYADDLIDVGIDSLTVTVNAVNPEIEAKICRGIIYQGRRYSDLEAAEILIENQLKGIAAVARAGLTVKVNTVLIPEINAAHVTEVARTVSALGAKIHNIIPLIPQHELAWCTEPACSLLNELRAQSEEYLQVFRHCGRCRADAAGLIGGTDVSSQLYTRTISAANTFSHG
jgi:nitrogen fixation protein NifB